MPTELELCAVSAVVGAMLGGAVAFVVTHKLDAAKLEHVEAANATTISRINATAAQQLAEALAKGQAAEGRIATLEQQYNNEVSQHAKDNLDYRAKLLAGTDRVRVRVATGSCAGAGADGAPATFTVDGPPTYADLSPTVAAGVFSVVDDADVTASKLRALQAYVKELQDDGYINK